jgi:uncharacterized membrane protein required for colicin V production
MSFNVVDILFIITVILLVLNGIRNGAVFSLISLLTIPLALAAVYYLGPQFTSFLAGTGFSATPLISYIILFFLAVLLLHIIASSIRGVVKSIPLISQGDALLGGVIGFVEAWLLWLILLIVLGSFLHTLQGSVGSLQSAASIVPGTTIQVTQLQQWHNFYNQVVTNSLFARVNGWFVQRLPSLPRLAG